MMAIVFYKQLQSQMKEAGFNLELENNMLVVIPRRTMWQVLKPRTPTSMHTYKHTLLQALLHSASSYSPEQ